MGHLFVRRVIVLLAPVFLLASVHPELISAAEAETGSGRPASALRPVTRFLNENKRATKRFWTPARMRSATPIEEVLGEPEPESWGPAVEGEESELRSVDGSGPSVTSPHDDRRALNLLESVGQNSGATVPPGEAIPYSSGEITETSLYPNITHGKLFFEIPGEGTYVCSGTVVGAESQNVVWTAGHCVTEGDGGGFFENFLFIPGYDDGTAPAGLWTVEFASTTSQWKNNEAFGYDVGALTMQPNQGVEIEEAVGSRGITFGAEPDQTYRSVGHPAAEPFDGEKMRFCASELGYLDSGIPGPMAIGCDMTPGSSGGGWIVEDPVTGGGFVHSVNSYIYPTIPETMFGPQMGDVAAAVYDAAGGEAPPPDTTPPRLINVVDGPDPFTPLAKRKRATKIRFTLGETAHVSFVIKSRFGRNVLKEPASKLQPARYYVKWNGRHFKTNMVVKAGRYTYKIKATDVGGNSTNKSGKVTVKR